MSEVTQHINNKVDLKSAWLRTHVLSASPDGSDSSIL